MVDKNEIRLAFSLRLHEALDDAGVRSRGRGVDVQKELKARGVNKTTQAVSKWLNGEAMAEPDSLATLCVWLYVRREWLEYGVLPKTPGTSAINGSTYTTLPGDHSLGGKVPLIPWDRLKTSREAKNRNYPHGKSWIYCPVAIGENGFALRVRGDSMMSIGQDRSYPDGCIIFIDPDAEVRTGDKVIAKVPDTNQMTFKVLTEDAGRSYLRPINPQYPIIDITNDRHICGKVIGSFLSE
jgi:SOS-response transcriptional repressor LexA